MKTTHKEPALRWHLQHNVLPQLTPNTVNGIINVCREFNKGKLQLNSSLHYYTGANITVSEMFEDLKIEVQ